MTSLQLRHWRNSVTLLQRVVRVEPDNFVARVMLGNALFERRQLDGALREYQAALRLRPDYPDAWEHAGAVLTEQGRPAEAMPYLLKAVELAPAWPEPQRRLALAWLRQGRIKEARAAYQKLVPLMPATAEGRRDLADMLAEGQQFAEAVHYYCEALRLKPDFDAALNNLAMLRASCPQPEFRDGQRSGAIGRGRLPVEPAPQPELPRHAGRRLRRSWPVRRRGQNHPGSPGAGQGLRGQRPPAHPGPDAGAVSGGKTVSLSWR